MSSIDPNSNESIDDNSTNQQQQQSSSSSTTVNEPEVDSLSTLISDEHLKITENVLEILSNNQSSLKLKRFRNIRKFGVVLSDL
jgi:hypothetical protein